MQVTMQVTTQVNELIWVFTREHFRKSYIQLVLDDDLIELITPKRTNSSKQKYRWTDEGILLKNNLL